MPIPVFRVEKNANYTTMSNFHLRDKTLSLKAKGLLSMLLSLPESWNYSVRGLATISREGKDGILSALQELEKSGYLVHKQRRGASGKMEHIEYVIFEQPIYPLMYQPFLRSITCPPLDFMIFVTAVLHFCSPRASA